MVVFAAVFTGFACAYADDAPKPDASAVSSVVVQAKAQAFSRALVELKLQEVALGRAQPVDQEKLALVRAQEVALNEELVKLAAAPLEAQLHEVLKTMNTRNPRVLELQEKIARCRAEIGGETVPLAQHPPISPK